MYDFEVFKYDYAIKIFLGDVIWLNRKLKI